MAFRKLFTCTPTANGGRPHFIRDNFLGISIQRRKPLKNDKVQFVRIYNGAYGFVILGEDDHDLPRFLHKDGVWRYSTYYDGLHSGYFQTEGEARKFIEEWNYENCTKL